jgi:hypothetical protein
MLADPSKPRVGKLTSEVQLQSKDPSKHIPSPSEDISDESQRRWDAYLSKSLLVLALLSGIALTFYIFVTYRVLFHSDSAVVNLLADEIIRTRQFFPSDWYYVNDIWILTPHLMIVPLALLFPESFTLHAVACFIFAMLFAGSLYLLYDASGLERNDYLFAISLLFSGLSPFFAENLFGQFAYGGSVASTFVVIALAFYTLRAYNARDRLRLSLWSGSLVIFLSIVLASGVRGLLLDVVPSMAALAIVTLVPQTGRLQRVFCTRAVLYVGLLIITAVVLGMASFIAIRAGIHLQNDKSAAHYVDYRQLKANIDIFLEGFLDFTGAMPAPNKTPVSIYGFITAYRLFWFGLVLSFPFWLLFRYRWITNPHFLFLIVYYVFSSVATLYLYVFSSLPENSFTFRYFVSPCILAIILIGYAAKELRLRHGTKWACFMVAACLPIYASSYDQIIAPYFKANVSLMFGAKPYVVSVRLHENPEQPVADYLVSQDLRYGYATYWNAGVVTILSGEKTRVSPILLNAPILPFRWLGPAYAYAANAFRGRTFLLLTDQEYADLNKAILEGYLGQPESVRSLPGCRIMVYGFNIAARLPDWENTIVSINDRYAPTDLRADLDCKINVMTMDSGQPGVLRVEVTNRSGKVFGSWGQFPINLGIHLYSQDLHVKNYDYVHSALPHVVKSGETVEVPAPLAALPRGEYILEVSMVQESVAWFGAKKDGQPLRIKVKVL